MHMRSKQDGTRHQKPDAIAPNISAQDESATSGTLQGQYYKKDQVEH